MSRPIFTVRGRVVYADGAPAPGAWVAVVDADPDLDDLLGVGACGPGGEFRLSFTTEAFNQEPAERELVPDLYLVLSVDADAGRVPVRRHDVGPLPFEGDEDLGTVALPLRAGERPTAAPGLRVAPGAGKLVKRLRLDDALVGLAAHEIAPLVEELTGWSGLLDGLTFEIVDSFADAYRRRTAALLGRDDFDAAALERIGARARACDAGAAALFDPGRRVIALNRPVLERWNVDALKVTIGHELVHVGQWARHPDLRRAHAAWVADFWSRALATPPREPPPTHDVWRLMANVEGYAHYIETTFLRRVYTHASEFGDVAAPATARLDERRTRRALERGFEQAKRGLTSGLGQPIDGDPNDLFTSHKAPQYAAGLAAYLARSPGGRPAPFDPELRPEPRLDDDLLATLIARALGGCAVSQLALGGFYAKGEGGVPLDREQAKVWLCRAIEGGLPVAGATLAALLPEGDPDQLRYYRMAAEAGLPIAQFATGFLLAREGPAHDPFEAARWFRRAAEQGNVEGMVRLGALYVEGVGVELDFAAASDWFTRAAEAGHVGAMRALAKMYGDGIGRKKDPIRARLWTNRADKVGPAAKP